MFNENTALQNNTNVPMLRQESPLVGVQHMLMPLASGSPALIVKERAFLERVNVKGAASAAVLSDAVRAHTGVTLPVTPNTVAESENFTIFWLAPNEWLIQSRTARPSMLANQLQPAFGTEFASAVDVTSGSTSLMLTGDKVAAVLQKGCPLDLHATVFAPGQCAQSHYFQAGILLRPLPDGAYEVVVRRSFADYFGRILLDAAREYLG